MVLYKCSLTYRSGRKPAVASTLLAKRSGALFKHATLLSRAGSDEPRLIEARREHRSRKKCKNPVDVMHARNGLKKTASMNQITLSVTVVALRARCVSGMLNKKTMKTLEVVVYQLQ